MEVKSLEQACQLIVAGCTDLYAVTYANAVLSGKVSRQAKWFGADEQDALKTQAAYIYDNLKNWKGETADAVRQFIKDYAGFK